MTALSNQPCFCLAEVFFRVHALGCRTDATGGDKRRVDPSAQRGGCGFHETVGVGQKITLTQVSAPAAKLAMSRRPANSVLAKSTNTTNPTRLESMINNIGMSGA